MSVTFNPKNGAVQVDIERYTPNDSVDEAYTQLIQKGVGRSTDPNYPKTVNVVVMNDQLKNIPGQQPAKIELVNAGDQLPMVALVMIENKTLKTLTYTNKDGNTNVIFSNNQKNSMKFVPGGIVFGAPQNIAPPEQNATGQSTQASGGGNLLPLCCSSMCMIGCGVLLTLAFKK